MAESIEERLLQAIEKDDLKAFNALMNEAPCGEYRLGRFPVLSLLYLYHARGIIFAYEEKFLQISAWEELREPTSVTKLFSERAGKCLRLYLNEVVSPLEMLLILDDTKRLKRFYPHAAIQETVKERLKTIYSVKYSLSVAFEGNDIILDRRPLSRGEKKRRAIVALSCALAAAIAVATPVTIVSLVPKRAEGEVTKLKHIDFGAQKTYTLKNDITIPDDFSVKKMNCTIIGDGNKLTLGKNASLGEFSGAMSDLEIETLGSPIFSVCTSSAVLSGVTVNVSADIRANDGTAFVALTNYGTLDGVTLNVSGKLSAMVGSMDGADELIFGGMVQTNSFAALSISSYVYGTIKNCAVNYSGFTLSGDLGANASFGGIVGVNNGYVQNSSVTGTITADTFDIGGACYVNGNKITRVKNGANLSQTSNIDDWTPIVSGIAIQNVGTVEYCENTGALTEKGSNEAICGGIVARNYGETNYCISSGDISVTAKTAYVGGIFGRCEVLQSGFVIYFGFADSCISEGKISVTLGEGESYIGGIGGFVDELVYDETTYFGGGITNCIFLGKIEGETDYRGNIAGVCGADIYERNLYVSKEGEKANFEKNYYLENDLPSFGAVETTEQKFMKVDGKGATPLSEDEIKSTEKYREILEKLGKQS